MSKMSGTISGVLLAHLLLKAWIAIPTAFNSSHLLIHQLVLATNASKAS